MVIQHRAEDNLLEGFGRGLGCAGKVMTPADALETFQRTRIDLLVLGSLVVRRSG